jgi:hypothetical protein
MPTVENFRTHYTRILMRKYGLTKMEERPDLGGIVQVTDGHKTADIDPSKIDFISHAQLKFLNEAEGEHFRTLEFYHLEQLMKLAAENIKQQWKQGNFNGVKL